MEEVGHYYSVYYISLAVGFRNRVARQYAFFAQMPDEVNMLDATHLEISYAKNCVVPLRKMCATENDWRIRVEWGLHALTGRNAVAEQQRTRDLILSTRYNDFLRLGFLLHRFGDTYAHTQIDNSDRLYFADPDFPLNLQGHGHLRHWHVPDEPWGLGRRGLMRHYLTDLYDLLDELSQKPANSFSLRPNASTTKLTLHQVLSDFAEAEQAVDNALMRQEQECQSRNEEYKRMVSRYNNFRTQEGVYFSCSLGSEVLQREYITVLRRRINERTGGSFFLDDYDPENRSLLTWPEFWEKNSRDYPLLLNSYNESRLRSIVEQIYLDTDTSSPLIIQ